MELKSFKELLVKKSLQNSYLQTLIKYAKDDLIADLVIESLAKMAEPSAAMGRGANSAVTTYAGQMTNSDVEQLRDALAHHISHYKGALKSGNREVADKHLNKIIPMMHLAGRAAKHSNGKMVLDYRSTIPWESNYTTVDRHPHNNKLIEGTKDLGRRPKKTRESTTRGVPDYRYLEMPPHPGHPDTKRLPAQGGYPFEEIQLGSPQARDAGKAYLPIEDLDNVKEYVPHPFDNHPIHAHADEPEHKRQPEHKEKFANDLAAWKDSEHHKKWVQAMKDKYTADPEAYKQRGHVKPKHVYEGLQLLDHPEHVKQHVARAQSQAPAEVNDEGVNVSALPPQLQAKHAARVQQQTSPAQAAAPAEAPKSKGGEELTDDQIKDIISKFSPQDLKRMPPAMKRMLKLKD